jgi:hypothetical protein
MEDIQNYGEDVNDFEVSPFESVQMLHNRSDLHKVYNDLTIKEKQLLATYDLILIKNAEKMLKHIQKAYDFSLSDQPTREWWWHLDKLIEGKISFVAKDMEQGMVI